MTRIDPDRLHRTVKLEVDEGRAATFAEAEAIASRYILQVAVGRGIASSPTRQAMLLTVVNAASRAFLGGVLVSIADDPTLAVPWAGGKTLSQAVAFYGGRVVTEFADGYPTVLVGEAPQQAPPSSILLYPTWDGWRAGVADSASDRLGETQEFPLAGVLAGALAVSESFQHARGDMVAGRRSVGLSLWKPQADWRDRDASGPACPYLPSRLWLLGLGHLGQAYCWALGFLPYADPGTVELMLQDFDRIVDANRATSLLARPEDLGQRKTRIAAKRLEGIGFTTVITERRFDMNTRRHGSEPGLALVGLDHPDPRRTLGRAGFDLIVDAGLGRGPQHYLDMLIHTFPSGITPEQAWPLATRSADVLEARTEQPAYRHLRASMVKTEAMSRSEAQCGVLQIAGQAVAAAFVGAAAACLVLAEALRALCGGPRYQVLALSLRSPQHRDLVSNKDPGSAPSFGYSEAAQAPETT